MKKIFFLVFVFLMACTNIPQEQGFVKAYFCPRDDCEQVLIGFIEDSSVVKCAFYDLDLENLTNVLREKNADVLIYKKNYAGFGQKVSGFGLMHNKFCVLDDVVVTGSFNPTKRGNLFNNNNLIIIKSRFLAKNYLDEFFEIKNQKKNKKTRFTSIFHNGFLVNNYFCPEDSCEEKILDILRKANSSIYFMTFSFTSDAIGDFLISRRNDIDIRGVFEKRQNSDYGEYKKMVGAGMNVVFDNNKYNMHHKVFIVDNKTVITGSYNPSKNANTRNDENILVIHSREMAERFLEEFNFLYS